MAEQKFMLIFLVLCFLWLCCGFHHSLAVTQPPLRPHCPPKPAQCHTSPDNSARNEHFYVVNDKALMIQFVEGQHFQLTCPENMTLEDPSLPRFNRLVAVEEVILTRCPPPTSSYVEALAALNVQVLEWLRLDEGLFSYESPLEARHLATLPNYVWKLTITAMENVPISENFTFNPSISDLRLTNLIIPPPVLNNLPVRLRTLHFMDSGLERIPTSALERLEILERIFLQDKTLTEVPEFSVAPMLREVFILAPIKQLTSLATIENVTLWNVSNLGNHIFGNCTQLKRLSIAYMEIESLPPRWLAECSRLEWLEVNSITNLKSLPEGLLTGATSLNSTSVRYCSELTHLPADLFLNTTQISYLDLSYNSLTTLPSAIFSTLTHLDYLDLSYNLLTPAARSALESLITPRTLLLAHNPLGDLCGAGDITFSSNRVSSLSLLTSLRTLDLRHTGATQLCRDWRDACILDNLDLSNNNITFLQFQDLHFDCTKKVDLSGNPIETIHYTEEDYRHVLADSRVPDQPSNFESNVTLIVDSLLDCDCRMYWFAKALQQRPAHLALPELRCRNREAGQVAGLGSDEELEQNGILFKMVPPENMTCPLDRELCATNCTCSVRPRSTAGGSSPGVTRALCENRNLTKIPIVPSGAPPLEELLLSKNAITTLTAEDLPHSLLVIDLSNNSIAHVNAETTTALFSVRARSMRVSGNPFACDCDNRLFLLALQAYQNQIVDYVNVTCEGGQRVRDVDASGLCTSRASLRAAIAVASVAAVLAAAAALLVRFRPKLVSRLKEALLKRGLCVRWALRPPQHDSDVGDEDKRYDVFVSFAHGDHRFVAECLVPRLETYRYRVCVHYRDFKPGEMISTQIETSVRNSRRTIVVLSENFTVSTWGRAEFRTAHALSVRDSKPRLVVIVLGRDKPEELPNLDQEWKDYLSNNTYLLCNDSWFWQRLKVALGRPRPSSTSSAEVML